jgi:hypothetical protein
VRINIVGVSDAPEYQAGVAGTRDLLREVGAGVVAAEQFCVGAVEHCEAHRRVEPAGRVEGELGIDRQPRGQHMTGCFGDVAQTVEVGPRSLGVDVVGGDG